MVELQKALRHQQAGRLQEAEALYRQILATAPNHADALHMLGVLSGQTGKHEAAAGLIERAIQVNPNIPDYHNNLGQILRALGKVEAAVGAYQQALVHNPNHAAACYNLGLAFHAQGKLAEAVTAYRQALVLAPKSAEIYNNLGVALEEQGSLDDAVAAFEQARALKPNLAETHYNLGNAHKAQGKLPEAITAYRQALKLNADFAEAHYNVGSVLKEQGKLTEAIACYQQALTLKPDFVEAHSNVGSILKEQGKLTEAIACYQRALTLKPDFAEAHYNLGNVLRAQARHTEAIAAFQRAVTFKPEFAEAYSNLGDVLRAQHQLPAAIAACRQALALRPDYAEAHNNLGIAFEVQSQLTEAFACYQQALALKPDFAEAHNNLGNALLRQGKLTEAIAAYRQALTLKPDYAQAHSNLLLGLHYGADSEPAQLLAEHQRWANQHAGPLAGTRRVHANAPGRERRLCIGYLSPDFRTHSVAFFVEPLLRAHDRAVFTVICYTNGVLRDAVTERLQGLADKWRNIAGLSDAQAAELIREDGVDILVDLAGHTADNRLLVFARKPAPVQVSYLGYPNTTGLSTMDYRLTDAWADPSGRADRFHTEELVRLQDGFLCYQPPPASPEVTPLPARTAGQVTFASFNNASKVNPEVIALWARILKALPAARLILKARQLGDAMAQQHITERFRQNGVAAARFEFLGKTPSIAEHLAMYKRVDIGLDPFPYNGTTTTCDALWMGVPVITLAGHAHAARVGVSLLSSVGHPELIAETPEAYVALAVHWAGDLERLQALRNGLREQMRHSPLTDASGFARRIEAAYRTMWRQWCKASGK